MTLGARSSEPELMDSEDLDADEYARCLQDLARVNRVTRTHVATLRWLARAIRRFPPGTAFSVMDVAYGQGDLLRDIHNWAKAEGISVSLSGIDMNPRSRLVASGVTPSSMAIDFRTGDVFEAKVESKPDFIVSSQFAHHLSDADVVRLLQWVERHSTRGWFIADLHRHLIPFYGFRILARLFGWHRVVRLDGTTSIARSFRRTDWGVLLERANVVAEVRWVFPFRYGVGRLK
jgi:SAM-dependent methyltransferase